MALPVVALVAPALRLVGQGALISLGGWGFNKLIAARGPGDNPKNDARYRDLLLHTSPHIGTVSRLALQSAVRGDPAAERVLHDLDALVPSYYTLLRRGPNRREYDMLGFGSMVQGFGSIANSAVQGYATYLNMREQSKQRREQERIMAQQAFAEWAARNRSRLQTRARDRIERTLAQYEAGRTNWAETYGLIDEYNRVGEMSTEDLLQYDRRGRVKKVSANPKKIANLRQKVNALKQENEELTTNLQNLARQHEQELAAERFNSAIVGSIQGQAAYGGGGYGPYAPAPGGGDELSLNSYLGSGEGPGIAGLDEFDLPEEFEGLMDAAPCLLPDLGELGEMARSGFALDASPDEAHEPVNCFEAGYRPDGLLREGVFYESPRLTAKIVQSLGDGVHGSIDLAAMKKPIRISMQSGSARATYATAHELAHFLDDRVKAGVDHAQVNAMGQAIVEDVFPAMQAFYERALGGR